VFEACEGGAKWVTTSWLVGELERLQSPKESRALPPAEVRSASAAPNHVTRTRLGMLISRLQKMGGGLSSMVGGEGVCGESESHEQEN
jgi:hypothetical protein